MIIIKNIPQQFNEVKDNDEEFLWTGAPEFLPFLCMGLPFLAVGLLWGAFDYFGFIRNMEPGQRSFLIPFMALHLFPFWAGILNFFRLILVYGNTFYAITNKRVMFRSGFWGTDFSAIDYDKISDIQVTVGPIESMLGVGSLMFSYGKIDSNINDILKRCFIGVAEPYEVFKKVKTVSVDIKTDWNYPNKLRPEDNPGYHTKYKPETPIVRQEPPILVADRASENPEIKSLEEYKQKLKACPASELEGILRVIDKDKYSDRYQAVIDELNLRSGKKPL